MARKFSDLVAASMSPESQARAAVRTNAMLADLRLADLRRAQDLSQAELSKILGVTQPEISKMERRADVYVSTLRKYVEATGGSLEILAHFPSGTVRIDQFSGAHSSVLPANASAEYSPTEASPGQSVKQAKSALRLRLSTAAPQGATPPSVIPIDPWLASRHQGLSERVRESDLTASIEPKRIACGY